MFRCVKTPKGIRMSLGPKEVDLFLFLGRELRRLLESGDLGHSLLKPFHPARLRDDDPRAAPIPHDDDLIRFRLDRIESMQRELIPRNRSRGGVTLYLDEARLDAWLAYLTDLRLLVGSVIGFSEDNPAPYPEDDPERWTHEIHMYHFLSAVQEYLLQTLMEEEEKPES